MIKYRSFELNNPEVQSNQAAYINDIYSLHKTVWDRETQALYNRPSKSDEFQFNTFVDVIYLDDAPVAYNLDRYCDLRCQAQRDQEWLRCWPDYILDDLTRDSPQLYIGNHLTVHPEYRRTMYQEINIAMVIAYLNIYHLAEMNTPKVGAMRLSRSTQKLAESFQATVLKDCHSIDGVDAQLVIFHPENLAEIPDPMKQLYREGEFYGY